MTVRCDFLYVILYFLFSFSLSLMGSNHPGTPLHFSNIDKESNGNLNASGVFQDMYSKYAVGFTLTASRPMSTYPCSHCGKVFAHRYSRNRHVKSGTCLKEKMDTPEDGFTIHEIKSAFTKFLSSISSNTQSQIFIFNDHWSGSKRSLRLRAAMKNDSNTWISSEALRTLVMRHSNPKNGNRFSFLVAKSVVIGYHDENPIVEEKLSTKMRNVDYVRSLRYRRAVPECSSRGHCDESIYNSESRCQCICPFGYNGPKCEQLKLTMDNSTSMDFRIPPAQQSQQSQFHLTFSYLTNSPEGDGLFLIVETATRDVTITLYMDKGKPSLNLTTNSENITGNIPAITNINSWQRIDLILNGNQLIFMLNLCQNTKNEPSECLFENIIKSQVDFSGGQFILGRPVPYQANAMSNLNGCVGDVRLNGEIQDMAEKGHIDTLPGCTRESISCGFTDDKKYGFCGVNGICYGSIIETSLYRCYCLPGFRHENPNDVKTKCDVQLSSYYFDDNSQARWLQQPFDVNTRPFINTFEATLRPWLKNYHVYSLIDINSDAKYLKILIENSRLAVYLNTPQTGLINITLQGVNMSDGKWHTIHVERNRWMLEILVDKKHYKFHYSPFTDQIIYSGDARIVGNNGIMQNRSFNGFQGCMKDVRMFASWYWMPLYKPQLTPTYIQSDMSFVGIDRSNCTDLAVCKKTLPCPPVTGKEITSSQWGTCECKCRPDHYENSTGSCVNICEVMPCVNGNCTVDPGNPRNRTCNCSPDYTGDHCEIPVIPVTPVTPAVVVAGTSLPWYLYLIIAIILLILLVLILFFVFCRRKHYVAQDTLDILEELEAIHETLGKDCDGAGEEDFDGYIDFSLLRKPICPIVAEITNPLKQEVPPKDWTNPSFDNDDHLDHPLEYGYEGQGSYVSLSSIASGSTDNDLNFDQLRNWGPRFKPLSELYKKPDE